VRRSVMETIDALAGGRTASAVDPRGLDYWLPYAMNAVIGLVEGGPDPAALDQARSLSREADTFVVAACGALGHGTAVADLLPVVLVGDTELTEHQWRIWRAAATGWFGELVTTWVRCGARCWTASRSRVGRPGWPATPRRPQPASPGCRP